MDLQHINVKVFVSGELSVDMDKVIEFFHAWVAEQSADELLIDIADYRHVPDGPGVVLVGHEADYAIDFKQGRAGLLYNRKAAVDGSNVERMQQAFRAAAAACRQLEQQFSGLSFDRRQLQLFVNDRALAPNNGKTAEACRGELESFARETLGQADFEMQLEQDPRQRFGVEYRFAQDLELG